MVAHVEQRVDMPSNSSRTLGTRVVGVVTGAAEHRTTMLGVALFLFVAIWVLRLDSAAPGDAVLALYAIPIALLAISFGPRGGLVGAAVAVTLFALWEQFLADARVGALGYGSRGAMFFVVGGVVGYCASLLRAHALGSSQRALSRVRVAFGQQRALELMATGTPVNQVLDELVLMVEREVPGMRASVLTVPDGEHLQHASAPTLPDEFRAAIDGRRIGPAAGSCGTAIWRGERVIVTDTDTDPLWANHRDLLRKYGLRAGWSTPIRGRSGDVVGSFAMYYEERRAPTHDELELADVAAALAGVVLENERALGQLRESEQRYREIVETANEGVWVVDADAVTSFVNARVCDMLGYPAQELIGVNPLRFMDEATRRVAVREFEERRQGRSGQHDACLIRRDGSELWVLVSGRPTFDSSGRFSGALSMLTDITERVGAEHRLRHLALHDAVTDLPNRTLLTSMLEHALLRQRRTGGLVAVVLVDLDNFKLINDTLGHQVGDELLVAVARCLRGALRASDTVARLAGDEFVVVSDMVHTDLDVAVLAERVTRAIDQPLAVGDGDQFVTGSVGVAVARDGDAGPEQLLRDADAAMYRAKRQGGARYEVFDEAMRDRSHARQQIIAALRDAVANDELSLHYQPIVDVSDQRPIAVEALLRWESAALGRLDPGVFIPIAEHSGVIGDVGAWVLEHAMSQAGSWPRNGDRKRPALTVNLSAREITGPHLVTAVEELLSRTGLEPADLWLEITESAVLAASDRVTRTLHELRALGPRIVLDDFGTGYSSLRHLLELPIDAIKIDRSFIAGLTLSSPAGEIVSAVSAMSHALDKIVIAEGVETAEQLHAVRDMGCDGAQGYLFSRPVPAAEFVGTLRERGGDGRLA